MNELVYLNGSLMSRQDAKISIMDYGFLYGYGVFETMRAYHGNVFRLDRHLNRLECTVRSLGIAVDTASLEEAVKQTIQANLLKEARIRLTVSGGEGNAVPDFNDGLQPTVLVVATPYVPNKPELYTTGFQVIISSIRRSSHSPFSQMKTLNYLDSLVSRREAVSEGAKDAILLNEKNNVVESPAPVTCFYAAAIS